LKIEALRDKENSAITSGSFFENQDIKKEVWAADEA
jgi:hypothetical protein